MPAIKTEAQLVDALNKMHDQAKSLAETIAPISAYLKAVGSTDQADEFGCYLAEATDAQTAALEFAQWIENRQ